MDNTPLFLGLLLLIAAATTIKTPPVLWNPSWTVRLIIGAAGMAVLLFSVVARRKPPR